VTVPSGRSAIVTSFVYLLVTSRHDARDQHSVSADGSKAHLQSGWTQAVGRPGAPATSRDSIQPQRIAR